MATIYSFHTSVATPQIVVSEELKEDPSSQENLVAKPGPSILLPLCQGLTQAQAREEEELEDTESQVKSEPSSEEEIDPGLDSDVEDIRLNRHLFGLEDLEGLLPAICTTEEIPEPAKETSAQEKMYRGLVKKV